eukprot:TRINITY_DN14681_c0_g1_i1.p1 TRINITY_DN14681_c0_g1~~TRINITY_DN14681_c0_g1_i1.p1  ORF type:complete len:413 (-),score=53.46 TRINITY_DN14681_c0_g1_i1:58-1296(-)
MRPILVLLVCFTLGISAIDPSCYDQLSDGDLFGEFKAPVSCSGGNPNLCLLLCGICSTPELRFGLAPQERQKYCNGPAPADAVTIQLATNALLNVSALHGYFWLDDPGGIETNATECFSYLLTHMPRRDLMLLFSTPFVVLDILIEHIRYALLTRAQFPWARAVPWDIFLDGVVPYYSLNEKRDLWWRWRARFYQFFAPMVSSSTNITAAVHILAAEIPRSEFSSLMMTDTSQTPILHGGNPVTWHSSTAPAYISPQQVVEYGGSCTGTGILFAAACRAVGVPARVAGCSESTAVGDDHHWIEFYDGTNAGPFGDYWHTREGVSLGNPDGPWDEPSAPMGACLQAVRPGDRMHSMWASSFGSREFLPLLWANDAWSQEWAFVGGLNRCGAYCTAWGCGADRKQFYDQSQCQP